MSIARTQIIDGSIAPSPGDITNDPKQTIGSIQVDGFMLPDGSYRMSLSQAAEMVELSARNAFDFLRSKAFKSRAGKGYTPQINARRFLGSKAIEALRDKGHTPDSFKA